jgi:hypothetical protein
MKYTEQGFFRASLFIIRGSKLIRFNSKPSHTNGQEVADRTTKLPIRIPVSIALTKIKGV